MFEDKLQQERVCSFEMKEIFLQFISKQKVVNFESKIKSIDCGIKEGKEMFTLFKIEQYHLEQPKDEMQIQPCLEFVYEKHLQNFSQKEQFYLIVEQININFKLELSHQLNKIFKIMKPKTVHSNREEENIFS